MQELDVEGPRRAEGRGQRGAQGVTGAEHLGPALGVVHGDPERPGGQRGVRPTHVVAQRPAVDRSPEAGHPAAEHPHQLRSGHEHVHQAQELVGWGGQVGVVVGHQRGPVVEGLVEATPHGLGLAGVVRQGEDPGAVAVLGHAGQHLGRGVGGAVVDEQERQRAAAPELGEGVLVEPVFLVEARHHHHGGDRGCVRRRRRRAHRCSPSRRQKTHVLSPGTTGVCRVARANDTAVSHSSTATRARDNRRPRRQAPTPRARARQPAGGAGRARVPPGRRAPAAGCGTAHPGTAPADRRLARRLGWPPASSGVRGGESGRGQRTATGRRGRSRAPIPPEPGCGPRRRAGSPRRPGRAPSRRAGARPRTHRWDAGR